MSGGGGDLNNSSAIEGGTDGTIIGNNGNKLLVDGSGVTQTTSDIEYPTFTAFYPSVVPGNLKSMASLMNASGSTAVIRIREIKIINVQTTAVTGVIINFKLRRMTGHSVGTLITTEKHDTSDTLNANVTARTGATIAGESATSIRSWVMSSDEWGVGTQDVESNQHDAQMISPVYDAHSKTKPITIRVNEGITIKCETNTAVGSFDMVITFTQE